MKRKEIAKYLDEIGSVVCATRIATLDDRKELSSERTDAALKGLSVGIALGAAMCSGEYLHLTPEKDALIAMSAVINLLKGDDDD